MAEKNIIDSCEEWQNTFDAISDYIIVLDNNNNILKANRSFLEFICLGKEDVINKKCYEIMHKTEKPWVDCPFEKTKIDGKPHSFEISDQKEKRHLMITISPVFNEKGDLAGSVHVAKDIFEMVNTKQILEKKIFDLEIFAKASVGRELKMIELKKKISGLEERLKEKNGNS